MKVAVLGARGFIGSYLCTHLWTMNYEVLPVTRETLDLTNFYQVETWLSNIQPDVVVNAAISGGGQTVTDVNYHDLQNNLAVFLNFYNSNLDFRYINIGSGAEFDKSKNLDNVYEGDLKYCQPQDTYGYSKNLISRIIASEKKSNFLTLRLFGCFGKTEPSFRLFPRFLTGNLDYLSDRYFDYISIQDFAQIVEYYCRGFELDYNDINCVYNSKYKLSDILAKLKFFRQLDIPIYTDGRAHLNYTGSSMRLDYECKKTNFPRLQGLEKGLELYE